MVLLGSYANSVVDNPQRARELGADSMLVKPTSADTLKARLRELVARSVATRPAGHV